MSGTPRRIVTGHDKSGKSIAVSDGAPPNGLKIPDRGLTFYEIWNTDDGPAPIMATEPESTNRPVELGPKPRGTVIRLLDFLPGFSQKAGVSPFMHRTETIDYGIVLEGEICLILADSEFQLKAGDVVVQRGTDHAWENRSGKLARMAFVLIDGAFSPDLKSSLPAGALEKVIRGPLGVAGAGR